MTAPLYPATRAIEHAVRERDARPLRFFAVLLPIWSVEISATIREAQPYEVFDKFLERAVAEAGLADTGALARFFGVETSLVDRAARFLTMVGHLRRDGDSLELTELGLHSVRDGCRYVIKEDRSRLHFDGFTCHPLPLSHYTGVRLVDQPKLELGDRTRFQPVTTPRAFDTGAVNTLLTRADRADYNVPAALTDARVLSVRQQWLPVYLVEQRGSPPYLVFSRAVEGRDTYLETVCNSVPELRDALTAEPLPDAAQIWKDWLAAAGFPDVAPTRLVNGVLRAVLPATAFGPEPARFRWAKLGAFEARKRSFLQLWCADDAVRERAAVERAATIVRAGGLRSRDEVLNRLSQLAGLLEIPAPAEERTLDLARRHDISELLSLLQTGADGAHGPGR